MQCGLAAVKAIEVIDAIKHPRLRLILDVKSMAGEQALTGLSEAHALPRPLEERHAVVRLERSHLVRERRLGDVELVCGPREPARRMSTSTK